MKISFLRNSILLSGIICFLAFFAGIASATILNVQILGHATNARGGPDEAPPVYTGAAVIGARGDYWNGVKVEMFDQPLTIVRPWKMLAADGKTAVAVKLKFNGFTGADHWPASDGSPVNNALLNSYLTSGAGASVMIEGLATNVPYDLYLFGNNSHAGAGAKFTVNGSPAQSTHGTQGPVFTEETDYVKFKGVTSDGEGKLKITLDPSSFVEAVFNGFQIEGDLPPPAAQEADPDSWGLKMWLKADELASTGLKPGDPVKKWADAAWGIGFAPNSKPPYSDEPPTYDVIKGPHGSYMLPVVRFNGQASLRQLDLLDVQDEEETAYVVYWNESPGEAGWKKLVAQRDGAMCTYPAAVYTVYHESGLRLGANAWLPIALAGHQGENNPGQRFKGGIAEVIVFAKHFVIGSEEDETVESYLQEKYFDTDGEAKADLQAPWTPLPHPSPPAQTGEATTTPLPETDIGMGLKQVSVFSMADQAHATNLEYAAGDVTLPFSYTARASTDARPPCLNFPGQPNPDCCHVFARIDGELWMFRADWIAGKGRPARYVGPDIDHMTRVEDGMYPPEVGLGWFLGGMWYDESQRKLYAPVHIEQEGIYRNSPVIGWFSRKIGLATSTDKGKTWKYEGDIITPETYFPIHDAYKFSGSDTANGLADFGFYVDTRGGYAYIYPEESWYPKGKFGGLWGVRAARCALSDKLAPGKWKFFYNGRWDEPALGGKSTVVVPSHLWGMMYSRYLGKYICMFPSNQDPVSPENVDGVMIGVCSDLSKQDWVWGRCPEAMFGFMKLFNEPGTDINSCDRTFRYYSYGGDNSFQRLDFTLNTNAMTLNNWMPRYGFEAHPESSDPVLSRKTKIVGSASREMTYSGDWAEKTNDASYEGRFKESGTARSSIEFSFTGSDVYWRALRSPASGKADIYLDGTFRKTVDCFSPHSTTYEEFVYLKTGLDSTKTHTIKIVVKGEKNPLSQGTAIAHIAFEYSAESYKASAAFCDIMGKNSWYYQQRKQSEDSDLRFLPRDDVFVKDWIGNGNCRVGNNYQVPDMGVDAIRKWVAPHAGVVRVEGMAQATNAGVYVRILQNTNALWEQDLNPSAAHDLTVNVAQGDSLCFLAGIKADAVANTGAVMWDPVVTYTQSQPAVWQPNPPGNENLALGKYARSKMLVYTYQPYNAVDGDANTAFAIYPDDRISSGDDWLEVDLNKKYVIDRYVLISTPPNSSWRPSSFTLQKSDDGFTWTDVDTVSKNTRIRCERKVPAFTARYVRLYLPKGKPFFINEFELFHTGGKRINSSI